MQVVNPHTGSQHAWTANRHLWGSWRMPPHTAQANPSKLLLRQHTPVTMEAAVYTSRSNRTGMRYASRAFSATVSDCDAAMAPPKPSRYFPAVRALDAVAGAATAKLLWCCNCSTSDKAEGACCECWGDSSVSAHTHQAQ